MNDGDTFNMSGNFQGAIINIKSILSSVHQAVETLPATQKSTKEELQNLIEQLEKALEEVPWDKSQEAEAVAETAKQLVCAAQKDKPNPKMIQISAESLKKAAENIASVLPIVLPIAKQITDIILKLTTSSS